MDDLPADPSRLRVSDQERHAVADLLRHAAGEGRLDLDELEERLEATYAAKTYAELVPLTADLPGSGTGQALQPRPAARPPVPARAYSSSFALMSETRRSGVWEVEATHTAFAVMGSVVLDLREARFTAGHTTINAHALMGGVEVWVAPEMQVVVDGIGIMGAYEEGRSKVDEAPSPDGPVVRVKGVALMGAVEVKRKARRGR
ncbi:DUF1707 SHOCT-like domain-containing protein [Nocardioides caldifontis]|uniref:DUF1707 SHOCT-like domain-containing protein n=1 Tax=Nocardioides caldifontis TaxID=2588938 RepID=UPI0011E02EA8|nr:DUF1707 domain-containing protein [Nocardioides caldifontis]